MASADMFPFVTCWPELGPTATFIEQQGSPGEQRCWGGGVIITALDQRCPPRGQQHVP